MKLEDFKRMTLEDRLDYLFEHSVKDSGQRFDDEKQLWFLKGKQRDGSGCTIVDSEPWPEFDDHPEVNYDPPPTVMLRRDEYDHARACVLACGDLTPAQLAMITEHNSLQRLVNEHTELRAALELHQELTRPIQRTIDILAKTKGDA